MGFPIRKSSDQNLLTAPQGLSQPNTSFIASTRQGIHRIPLSNTKLRHLVITHVLYPVVYIRFTLNQSFSMYCEFVSHLVSTHVLYSVVYIRFTLNQSFSLHCEFVSHLVSTLFYTL